MSPEHIIDITLGVIVLVFGFFGKMYIEKINKLNELYQALDKEVAVLDQKKKATAGTLADIKDDIEKIYGKLDKILERIPSKK